MSKKNLFFKNLLRFASVKGFTLLEVVFVVAISGTLMLICSILLKKASSKVITQQSYNHFNNQACKLLDKMGKDIESAFKLSFCGVQNECSLSLLDEQHRLKIFSSKEEYVEYKISKKEAYVLRSYFRSNRLLETTYYNMPTREISLLCEAEGIKQEDGEVVVSLQKYDCKRKKFNALTANKIKVGLFFTDTKKHSLAKLTRTVNLPAGW